ncbi:sensor histidine kinase [Pseudomonas sp. 3A(2025)]
MISPSTPLHRLSRKSRSLNGKTARWLTATLCLGALLGNTVVYLHAQPLPAALLLLNALAFASIWLARLRSNRAISLQPQELASRMLEVQENERHRLSRELHDDIGQMLTAARLQLDWLQRRLPAELEPQGKQLNATLEETLDKVRDLSAILNPRQLSSLGLEASLRSHLMNTLAGSTVHWSLQCHQPLHGIAEEMAVATFRITQEAVTNMLRHAGASNLLIRLQRLPEGLTLFIADDGHGFTPASDPARAGQRGIAGIGERVALLGGRWTLDSAPGQGTRINVVFPWSARHHARARTQGHTDKT